MPLFIVLQTELLYQFFHRQVVMCRHRFEHAFDERAGLERLMLWNRDVMLPVQLGLNANMRAVLAVKLITQNAQGSGQIVA
jgi:hypothetical protein